MLVLGNKKKLNKVVIEMRKEILTVATVKHGTVEQAKEIALQAWNINNHGTYVGLKFSTYDDTVEVKYFEDSDTNIKSVVASWVRLLIQKKQLHYCLMKEISKKVKLSMMPMIILLMMAWMVKLHILSNK